MDRPVCPILFQIFDILQETKIHHTLLKMSFLYQMQVVVNI